MRYDRNSSCFPLSWMDTLEVDKLFRKKEEV